MTAAEYPPARHVLRDLPFEIEVLAADAQRAHLGPYDWTIGALATVVDVVGGSVCAGVVSPDWMATSSLTVRVAQVPAAPSVLDATVVRAGRRTVTIEVQGCSGGSPVLSAMLAFSRLERREDNLDLSDRSAVPGARYGFGPVDPTAPRSFGQVLSQRTVDAATGTTETPITPDLRNSFGAVNGGVVAGIAVGAATASCGSDPVVDEVSVHHLGQGRHGPVRTSAATVLELDRRRVVRVEVRDAGAPDEPDGRLMALAHVGMYVRPASV